MTWPMFLSNSSLLCSSSGEGGDGVLGDLVMAKKQSEEMAEVEFKPDGWSRFERAVDAAVKSGPKHKKSDPAPKSLVKTKDRPASKGRVHKGKSGI